MTPDRDPARTPGGEGASTGAPSAPGNPRFPSPPLRFRDARDRPTRVREARDDFESLLAMYAEFHPDDRAQGIPPARRPQLRDWLGEMLEHGHNVLAEQDGEVVGHACLIPDRGSGGRSCELAIFVLRGYQHAGIGTELLRALLGLGEERGVETVWLSVERWNGVAVHLYRKAGFVTRDTRGFELEMELELA